MKQNDLMKNVGKQLANLMETQGSDWVKTWTSQGMPHNPITKHTNSGMNVFLLGLAMFTNGWKHNGFVTFHQCKKAGGQVMKGSKSTWISRPNPIVIREETENGQEIVKTIPRFKFYPVFNIEQTTLEFNAPVHNHENENYEQAENFVHACHADIRQEGDRAYFDPANNFIGMPEQASFPKLSDYYSTLFHEFGHWTGHKDRLDRKLSGRYGTKDYAFEELVAEITSCYLAINNQVEKEATPGHAKYLNSWVGLLKDNPKAMQEAFTQAQQACDYLQGLQM